MKHKDIPTLYYVIWRNDKGELKQFGTNCEDTALKMEVRRKGTTYIDTRYKAKLRLYYYLLRKQMYA